MRIFLTISLFLILAVYSAIFKLAFGDFAYWSFMIVAGGLGGWYCDNIVNYILKFIPKRDDILVTTLQLKKGAKIKALSLTKGIEGLAELLIATGEKINADVDVVVHNIQFKRDKIIISLQPKITEKKKDE